MFWFLRYLFWLTGEAIAHSEATGNAGRKVVWPVKLDHRSASAENQSRVCREELLDTTENSPQVNF